MPELGSRITRPLAGHMLLILGAALIAGETLEAQAEGRDRWISCRLRVVDARGRALADEEFRYRWWADYRRGNAHPPLEGEGVIRGAELRIRVPPLQVIRVQLESPERLDSKHVVFVTLGRQRSLKLVAGPLRRRYFFTIPNLDAEVEELDAIVSRRSPTAMSTRDVIRNWRDGDSLPRNWRAPLVASLLQPDRAVGIGGLPNSEARLALDGPLALSCRRSAQDLEWGVLSAEALRNGGPVSTRVVGNKGFWLDAPKDEDFIVSVLPHHRQVPYHRCGVLVVGGLTQPLPTWSASSNPAAVLHRRDFRPDPQGDYRATVELPQSPIAFTGKLLNREGAGIRGHCLYVSRREDQQLSGVRVPISTGGFFTFRCPPDAGDEFVVTAEGLESALVRRGGHLRLQVGRPTGVWMKGCPCAAWLRPWQ